MSPIATIAPSREMPVPRTATAPAAAIPVEPTPASDAPARQTASPPVADMTPDARFDSAVATREQAIRQVARQISASMMYGAHVSVVSTATGIHATIDVSA